MRPSVQAIGVRSVRLFSFARISLILEEMDQSGHALREVSFRKKR